MKTQNIRRRTCMCCVIYFPIMTNVFVIASVERNQTEIPLACLVLRLKRKAGVSVFSFVNNLKKDNCQRNHWVPQKKTKPGG